MKILSVEPTPSSNNMKLNVNETATPEQSGSFTLENVEKAPQEIQDVLRLEGVKNVYRAAELIAVERNPKMD